MKLAPSGRREWTMAGLRILGFLGLLVAALGGRLAWFTSMPGESFAGPRPALDAEGEVLRARLGHHVDVLAGQIGERNALRRPEALEQAARYLEESLRGAGYETARQSFSARGQVVANIEVELAGGSLAEEIRGHRRPLRLGRGDPRR